MLNFGRSGRDHGQCENLTDSTRNLPAARRCAFLTMRDTAGWSIDADLAFAPLAGLGWDCVWLPWQSQQVDWGSWDAVYVAATWDYHENPDAFIAVLETIDRSSATLVNPLKLIRWNIPKTYLRELEGGGVNIVPSRWYERFVDCDLVADAVAFGVSAIIVKPVVSTNATDTFLLELPVTEESTEKLSRTFLDRAFIVQPFIRDIQSGGEFSLFYIGGAYSHAIRKVPKPSDFRVQEEHGAEIQAARPDASLIAIADQVMALLAPEPLYARCDFVRDAAGVYRVMELELIEPSLYLRMDNDAPRRFAEAFDLYIRARRGEQT